MITDDIDRANEYAARLNEEALAKRMRYTGPSAHQCIDFGNPIPEERRASIAGVQACIGCAVARERRLA